MPERLFAFDIDGDVQAVPASQLDAFKKDAEERGYADKLQPVEMFDLDGESVAVPAGEIELFRKQNPSAPRTFMLDDENEGAIAIREDESEAFIESLPEEGRYDIARQIAPTSKYVHDSVAKAALSGAVEGVKDVPRAVGDFAKGAGRGAITTFGRTVGFVAGGYNESEHETNADKLRRKIESIEGWDEIKEYGSMPKDKKGVEDIKARHPEFQNIGKWRKADPEKVKALEESGFKLETRRHYGRIEELKRNKAPQSEIDAAMREADEMRAQIAKEEEGQKHAAKRREVGTKIGSLGVEEKEPESQAERWGQVAGSGVASVGTAVAAGPLLGGTLLAAESADATHREAVKAGMRPIDASRVADKEFFWQIASEALPIEAIKRTKGGLQGALTGAAAESIQEIIQQAGSNLLAREFDPDRQITEGFAEAAVGALAGGGVAGGVQGYINSPGGAKAAQRVNEAINTTLEDFGADKKDLDALKPDERLRVHTALVNGLDAEDGHRIVKTNAGIALFDKLSEKAGFGFARTAQDIAPNFNPPMAEGPDGKPVPNWTSFGGDGRSIEDAESGIAITQDGKGEITVWNRKANQAVPAESEQEAVELAKNMSVYNQAVDRSREKKLGFLSDSAARLAGKVEFQAFNTFDELMAAHGEEIEGASKNTGGVKLADGTVAVVLDNIGSPYEMLETVLHEAGVHVGIREVFQDKAARDEFLGKIDKREIAPALELVKKKGYDPNSVAGIEEALAYMYEKRTANPTTYQRGVAALHDQFRKLFPKMQLSRSDIEVIMSRAQRQVRGEGGIVENRGGEAPQNAPEAGVAQPGTDTGAQDENAQGEALEGQQAATANVVTPSADGKSQKVTLVPEGVAGRGKAVAAAVGQGAQPGEVSSAIERAENETETQPTESQKESGNYKKGRFKLFGLEFAVENPKGSIRSGIDNDGRKWKTEMKNTYGYFANESEGKDGDKLDFFLGDSPENGKLFIVDQVDPKTGKFDEHKVMVGFATKESAEAAYRSNYERDWNGFGGITESDIDTFKEWVRSSGKKTKPFSEYKGVGVQNAVQPAPPTAEPVQAIAPVEQPAPVVPDAPEVVVPDAPSPTPVAPEPPARPVKPALSKAKPTTPKAEPAPAPQVKRERTKIKVVANPMSITAENVNDYSNPALKRAVKTLKQWRVDESRKLNAVKVKQLDGILKVTQDAIERKGKRSMAQQGAWQSVVREATRGSLRDYLDTLGEHGSPILSRLSEGPEFYMPADIGEVLMDDGTYNTRQGAGFDQLQYLNDEQKALLFKPNRPARSLGGMDAIQEFWSKLDKDASFVYGDRQTDLQSFFDQFQNEYDAFKSWQAEQRDIAKKIRGAENPRQAERVKQYREMVNMGARKTAEEFVEIDEYNEAAESEWQDVPQEAFDNVFDAVAKEAMLQQIEEDFADLAMFPEEVGDTITLAGVEFTVVSVQADGTMAFSNEDGTIVVRQSIEAGGFEYVNRDQGEARQDVVRARESGRRDAQGRAGEAGQADSGEAGAAAVASTAATNAAAPAAEPEALTLASLTADEIAAQKEAEAARAEQKRIEQEKADYILARQEAPLGVGDGGRGVLKMNQDMLVPGVTSDTPLFDQSWGKPAAQEQPATPAADVFAGANVNQPAPEGDTMYRLVTDEVLLDRLESGEKVKAFRAMQIIDGKLYPPMSAKINGKLREPTEIGKWEQSVEQPELSDGKGHFKLNKGNGKRVEARYNPYFHTSLSPLNDQFSSAYDRPNLVTVEVELPKSELTSVYKAKGAKDSVGVKRWHTGPVSSKLKGDKARRVILSRYAKTIRVVPDGEVADHIAKTLDGENIAVPENVVTPSLASELVKRGVNVQKFARPDDGIRYREAGENTITYQQGNDSNATDTQTRQVRAQRLPQGVDQASRKDYGRVYADFLRRGSSERGDWYTDFKQGRISKEELKFREGRLLAQEAERNGDILPSDDFDRRNAAIKGSETPTLAGGGENRNALETIDGVTYVVKRNNVWYSNSYLDFFNKIALHNYLFPQTEYEFVGFMYDKAVDRSKPGADAALQPVLRQRFVVRDGVATKEEVRAAMEAIGFRDERNGQFVDDGRGIVVLDLENGNVLVDKAGDVAVIDPVIETTERFWSGDTMFREAGEGMVTPEQDAAYMADSLSNFIPKYDGVGDQIDKTWTRNVEQRFGVKIVVTEDVPGDVDASGYTVGSKIFITPTAGRGVVAMGVVAHELSHRAEQSGRPWEKYADAVLLKLYGGDDSAMMQDAKTKILEYGFAGVELSTEDALREIVAEFTRNKLYASDSELFKLAKTDRGLVESILDFIKYISDSVRATFGKELDVDALRRKFEKALNAARNATSLADSDSVMAEDSTPIKDTSRPNMTSEIQRAYDAVVAQYTNPDGTRNAQWMKAPNGANTKLNERQWVQVRTPAFKKWFGDWENDPANASKIVDENGEPMVVFHGTKAPGFTEFNTQWMSGTNTGAFFSDNKEVADTYSKDTDGVYQTFLNLKNVKTVDFEGEDWGHGPATWVVGDSNTGSVTFDDKGKALAYAKENGIEERLVKITGSTTNSQAELANKQGFDGIIIKNVKDSGYFSTRESLENAPASTIMAVLNATDIKSATDNTGEFSAENADIRYRVSDSAVTAAQDAAYLAAVERGDEATAQRMVDEAAKKAGYNVGPVWHGTATNKKGKFPFVEFKTGELGGLSREAGETEAGSFFTADEAYARGVGIYKSSWRREGKHAIHKAFYLRNPDVLVRGDKGQHTEYRATSPSQIKSADAVTRDDAGRVIPLSERFNKKDDDVRYRLADDAALDPPTERSLYTTTSALAGTPEDDISLVDKVRVKTQDFRLPIRRMYEQIMKRPGATFDRETMEYTFNAERRRSLFSVKREEMSGEFVAPILTDLKAGSWAVDDLDRYAQALHAPYYNRMVADRRNGTVAPGAMADDLFAAIEEDGWAGKGLADSRAEQIVANYNRRTNGNLLKRAAEKLAEMNRKVLDQRVSDGLMSKEQANLWKRLSPYYVPLKVLDAQDGAVGVGGKNLAAKESKRAIGHFGKENASSFINSLIQMDAAINRGLANKERQNLWRFLQANPDASRYVLRGKIPSHEKTTGKYADGTLAVTTVPDMMYLQKDGVVPVKFEGVVKYIEFIGPAGAAIGKAVKETTLKGRDFEAAMRPVMHLYKWMRTMGVLDFALRNGQNDAVDAFSNMAAEGYTKEAAMAAKIIPSAWKMLVQHERGKTITGPYAKYYEEYKKSGSQMANKWVDATGKTWVREIELSLGIDSDPKATKLAKSVIDNIEKLNTVVEIGTRFSVYTALRESGKSVSEAAEYARNITVDFERKGEWTPILNTLWAFSNVAVQGNARFIRSIVKGKHGRRFVGAVLASAFLNATLNMMLSEPDDEDDEDEYMKIRDHIKKQRILLHIPGTKKYATIRARGLPGWLWWQGTALAEATFGRRSWGGFASQMPVTLFETLNPLGQGEGITLTATPSLAAPFVQQDINKKWTGQPLVPGKDSPWMKHAPRSTLAYESTPQMYKATAKYFNAMTGGDAVTSGKVDVSPEIIKHWVDFAVGSFPALATRSLDTTLRLARGEDIPVNSVPVLRDFMVDAEDFKQNTRYYDAIDEFENSMYRLKKYEKYEDRKKVYSDKPYMRSREAIKVKIRDIKALEDKAAELQLKGLYADRIEDVIEKRQKELSDFILGKD